MIIKFPYPSVHPLFVAIFAVMTCLLKKLLPWTVVIVFATIVSKLLICDQYVFSCHVTWNRNNRIFLCDCALGWTEHFIVKINDGQSRRIKCMALKCNVVCDEAKIRCLVSARDSNIADKFERFLLESYIDDNRRVKWCPSVPHCGNAIQVEADELCEVECACGFQFCFSCSSVAHSPCSCLMWELWSKKFEVESLSLNWISSHTKPCPKCCKPIEKNGGCNMVRCKCGITFK